MKPSLSTTTPTPKRKKKKKIITPRKNSTETNNNNNNSIKDANESNNQIYILDDPERVVTTHTTATSSSAIDINNDDSQLLFTEDLSVSTLTQSSADSSTEDNTTTRNNNIKRLIREKWSTLKNKKMGRRGSIESSYQEEDDSVFDDDCGDDCEDGDDGHVDDYKHVVNIINGRINNNNNDSPQENSNVDNIKSTLNENANNNNNNNNSIGSKKKKKSEDKIKKNTNNNHHLNILICSCNLGNALPTRRSLASWIPDNGDIDSTLLALPDHPLPFSQPNFRGTNNRRRPRRGKEELPQAIQPCQKKLLLQRNRQEEKRGMKFDIIAIGMQEAAFQEEKVVESSKGGGGNKKETTKTAKTTKTESEASKSPPPQILGLHDFMMMDDLNDLSASLPHMGDYDDDDDDDPLAKDDGEVMIGENSNPATHFRQHQQYPKQQRRFSASDQPYSPPVKASPSTHHDDHQFVESHNDHDPPPKRRLRRRFSTSDQPPHHNNNSNNTNNNNNNDQSKSRRRRFSTESSPSMRNMKKSIRSISSVASKSAKFVKKKADYVDFSVKSVTASQDLSKRRRNNNHKMNQKKKLKNWMMKPNAKHKKKRGSIGTTNNKTNKLEDMVIGGGGGRFATTARDNMMDMMRVKGRRASLGGGGGGGSHQFHHRYDTQMLHEMIEDRCPSYGLPIQYLNGEMRLVVLVRKDLLGEISDVDCKVENTGIGKVLANKGGIVATLTIQKTRLSFITCHLEAHEGSNHYEHRNKNLSQILSGTKVGPLKKLDVTMTSHHCFVFGDLNYRINLSKTRKKQKSNTSRHHQRHHHYTEDDVFAWSQHQQWLFQQKEIEDVEYEEGRRKKKSTDEQIVEVNRLVEERDWDLLNRADELSDALRKRDCLVGFRTLPCHFPPTFKVKRGCHLAYNEKRIPSFTDRILWKSSDGLDTSIVPTLYEPCLSFETSDHKPIRGAFEIITNQAWSETNNSSNTMTNDDTNICPQPPVRRLSMTNNITTSNENDNVGGDTGPRRRRSLTSFRQSSLHQLTRQISSTFYHQSRSLYFFITNLSCTNLPAMDYVVLGGRSDPYIKFRISPKHLFFPHHNHNHNDSDASVIRKKDWPCTKVKKKELNPTWHEHITLKMRGVSEMDDLVGGMLFLSVYDYDLHSFDDLIGTVQLSLERICGDIRPGEDKKWLPLFPSSGFGGGGGANNSMSWIQRTNVDQPVLRDGTVKGRMKCSVFSCWLSEKEYDSFKCDQRIQRYLNSR